MWTYQNSALGITTKELSNKGSMWVATATEWRPQVLALRKTTSSCWVWETRTIKRRPPGGWRMCHCVSVWFTDTNKRLKTGSLISCLTLPLLPWQQWGVLLPRREGGGEHGEDNKWRMICWKRRRRNFKQEEEISGAVNSHTHLRSNLTHFDFWQQ